MKKDQIAFIGWLVNRLLYKHLYSQDDAIISKLKELTQEQECDIDDVSLDMIISRYYVDFNLDKSEDFSVGFSDIERQKLRTTIRSIINDAINKRFYKEPLIKG
ncbi:MAG: hypothetical protein ACKO7N_01640 [Candidatus Nitrosotenuis sp.]